MFREHRAGSRGTIDRKTSVTQLKTGAEILLQLVEENPSISRNIPEVSMRCFWGGRVPSRDAFSKKPQDCGSVYSSPTSGAVGSSLRPAVILSLWVGLLSDLRIPIMGF